MYLDRIKRRIAELAFLERLDLARLQGELPHIEFSFSDPRVVAEGRPIIPTSQPST